jgi:hypothetical protein
MSSALPHRIECTPVRPLVAGFLAVATLASLPLRALAAEDPFPHFVRNEMTISCQAADGKIAASEADCMRIGPLHVGMRKRQVEALLDKPLQETKQNGITYFGYSIVMSGGKELGSPRQLLTSATVTYDADGKANSIQIGGAPWPGRWSFLGLTLGDNDEAVRARLGEPIATGPGAAPGTVIWSYGPSIAFDLAGRKIQSIHLSNLKSA